MTRAAASDDLFLTPRVIDQGVFNDLAASLRHHRRRPRGDRRAAADDAAGGAIPDAGRGGIRQLQERLGLGARMLKACQIQMEQMQDGPRQRRRQRRAAAALAPNRGADRPIPGTTGN